ncbi:MAG TPA: thiamine pyrophosphate-binding protein [Usitatibacter sp.]|nr:thiamine pyrophosphate-binding protein [Usitatibacter sp.]
MSDEKKAGLDRRAFLKTAAATAGVAGAAPAIALAQAGDAHRTADAHKTGGDSKAAAAEGRASGHGLEVIDRPGSDFMVDVIKTLDLEYMSMNPGSSYRSLHESLINYGGNKAPELITCMHEEAAVAMAHGYSKAAGKPMGVAVHGTVGLQHATMAIYNAWVDRVPIVMFAGNGLDITKRRPGTEWNHSVQDPALIARDFLKWDDYPMSLQHFAESAVRAYKIATTPPMEPVLITADIDLQEEPVHDGARLSIPKLAHSVPPQGERAALAEAAKWLVGATHPVIIADRCARTPDGVKHLVELAEALQAPVIDLGGRMNFPNNHPLYQTAKHGLMKDADVVLLLEVSDPFGQFNSISDPAKKLTHFANKDAKVVNISMQDVFLHSNYQDFQRYWPVDLSINGDAEASLPALTEEVRRLLTDERKRAFAERGARLKDSHVKSRKHALEEAAVGWDGSPISTARMAMELYATIRNEPWCLAVSDRIKAPRDLWTVTEHHQMLGGAGAQGVGFCAPGSLGTALANKSRGRFTVTFQPDGDLNYSPGVLWTAAHHQIPILYVMFNNRAYLHETMHIQRMAGLHNRDVSRANIGTTIDNPFVDYAKLAQAYGVWAEGPITDPSQLAAVYRRAVDVVKSGHPALVDVVCQGA